MITGEISSYEMKNNFQHLFPNSIKSLVVILNFNFSIFITFVLLFFISHDDIPLQVSKSCNNKMCLLFQAKFWVDNNNKMVMVLEIGCSFFRWNILLFLIILYPLKICYQIPFLKMCGVTIFTILKEMKGTYFSSIQIKN